MSYNAYSRLRSIFPEPRLQVGALIAIDSGRASVQLPDGTVIVCRGIGTAGENVYVRDGVIEGAAPTLPLVTIQI